MTVKIYLFDISNINDAYFQTSYMLLPVSFKKQVDKLKNEIDKRRKVFLLTMFYKLFPNTNLKFTKLGRPYIKNNNISFSHSGSCCCIACSKEVPIGIDIEIAKKDINYEQILTKFPTHITKEIKTNNEFYVFWTKFEALYKLNNKLNFKNIKKLEFSKESASFMKKRYSFYDFKKNDCFISLCTSKKISKDSIVLKDFALNKGTKT